MKVVKTFNRLKKMYHYGHFEKRIIITFIEFFLSSVIWIVIDQYMTYSLFDSAIAKENIRLVLFLSILMIIKNIVNISEGILNCILRHHLQRDFSNYARKEVFNKLINSKIEYFDNSSSSYLFELIVNDTNNLAMFFTQNSLIPMSFGVRALTYIVILLFMNVKLTLLLIIVYIIGYIALILSNKKTFILLKNIREANILVTKWTTEEINCLEIIKSLRLEKDRLDKINKLIKDYNDEENKLDNIVRKYTFIYNIFSLLAIVIVTYVGGIDILKSTMTYGSLMIFINATSSIKRYCDIVIRYVDKLNKSYISFCKVLKFNDEVKMEEDKGNLQLEKINNIEFKNINFSYNSKKKILKDINIEVNKGDKIAIIGRTGSGKTTLANILCRFYDLENGQIKINDIDYKQYKLNALRKEIGYVMQDVVIFEGNVYENINYVKKEISNEDIVNICKRLNLHNKIMSLKDGYETDLSKNKDTLSQGEKQMINFARILVEDPSLIILDEVTSSLSYSNEELIKNAINEITKGRICFIIAHRLSTIKSCNKILLMKDGKIMETKKYFRC
ncbi:ABC transporter ATP-binding protein [uncultured Clostridium sp.]|uniref:ABC transporter ATP-binding protein n=1 Tax=uncultured Clostridium sp. TaxID=59620 RepID=UPI00259224EF|nr:ABC transporter ATP-binding protein [uncultured Clostridium sp.]